MEINAKNNMLESRLEDANKLLKFYMTREKSIVDGKFEFNLITFYSVEWLQYLCKCYV